MAIVYVVTYYNAGMSIHGVYSNEAKARSVAKEIGRDGSVEIYSVDDEVVVGQ